MRSDASLTRQMFATTATTGLFLLFFAGAAAKENFELFPDLPIRVIDTDNVICKEQSRMYVEHLRNLSLWAYQMHDATAKSVTGILTGSFLQFGQFQECLEAQAPFPTQYCLTTITANIPEPDPPRDPKSLIYEPNESVLRKMFNHSDPSQQSENIVMMGWCTPAACSPNELQNYLTKYLNEGDFPLKRRNVTYSTDITENVCQREGEYKDLDHVTVSFGLVIIIIVSLVTFSTAYDILRDSSDDKLKEHAQFTKLLLSFSLKNNYNKLPYADDSGPLRVLYGVRVFCICMIIIDHRFGVHLSSMVLNYNAVELQYRSTVGSLFFHGDLFVDSFFVLSGMLVTYCLLLQYDKRFTNPALIIFLRYIRLTPLYAFVVFYYAAVYKYTGEGPMWKSIVNPEVQDCRDNWWTNILYINNYVNVPNMCMVQSWYLPCDLHYFILAVLICVIIHKNKRIGLVFLGAVTFVSILVPFVITVIYEAPPLVYFYPDFLRMPKKNDHFVLSYTKSHMRASTYFVGMIIGYVYYRMKDSEKCLKKGYSQIILVVSLVIMAASLITGSVFYDPYYKYNAIEAGLYASLHRTAWAIGSAGVLYVASYGHAKSIYRFLSWKPWVPLSKLTYGAYLLHFQFQLRSLANRGGPDYITYFDIIYHGMSDIVLSFVTAFILYLTVESPVRNIFNLLLIPPKRIRPPKIKENQESVSETTCDSHL